MTKFILFPIWFFLATARPQSPAQDEVTAKAKLEHALHLADLYNWDDARDDFATAENLFQAQGDERNALYAKLGRIRATVDQRALATTATWLGAELQKEPFLRADKRLRLFCLIVKGDIDGEIDAGAMREDWEQVQDLASQLGDKKWQYRALAELGIAAFYNGDLATAGKNVATALAAATQAGDVGAQVIFLTALGIGMRESHMNQEALSYFDRALKVAAGIEDIPYPFFPKEALLENLVDLKRDAEATRLADEILMQAQRRHHPQAQAIVMTLKAHIAVAHGDAENALRILQEAMDLSSSGGFVRDLADAQALASDVYRNRGDLARATEFASLAANSTQESGDAWSVPRRLEMVALLDIKQGKYHEADAIFDRASAFVDALVGNYSSVLQKTAIIKASSDLYSQHFALVADQLNDPAKAYSVVEQVRGRVTTDLLMAGAITSPEAKNDQRAISELRLKLAAARSTAEVQRIRDQIFRVEQSQWITPEISILKARSHEPITIGQVQKTIGSSAAILEYVLTDPKSYCLVISNSGAHIVPLAPKQVIDGLVASYLKSVKAKTPANAEARRLYDVLLAPLAAAGQKENFIIVRDASLFLIPFDALIDKSGHLVAETHTVIYEPSATSFYLLRSQTRPNTSDRGLLAVGGVSYNPAQLKEAGVTRGYAPGSLTELPASKDEVIAAEAAVHSPGDVVLIGPRATEAAFKSAANAQFDIIHLAVHGYASTTERDRSALVLLSDPGAGEDGFLQASEIVQLHLNAELVVLSACDTAVGPLEGEEGISTLSRAFLLAGARTVVSTLWAIDDTFSLFLMKRFYQHIGAHEPPSIALAAAKRDMLRKYGAAAVPYYWAAYTVEGAASLGASNHE
ncbi:MAG TPA: CHAT domain-containing protein [Bryobacteraceae bacterium]|nr:CHAT domain-containing protein [Bryobacteraceae bacterium]